MCLSLAQIAGNAEVVGIGAGRIGCSSDTFRATLGSCVGVCLVWAREDAFGFAHVLLPESDAPVEDLACARGSRFADTAVDWLLDRMAVPQRRRRELVAYLAGGARMFRGHKQQTAVGELNQRAVQRSLAAHRIRVRESDLGGGESRQMIADGKSRAVYVVSLESDRVVRWNLPSSFGWSRHE